MTTERSIRRGCWRAVLTASAIALSFAASAAANETIIYFHQDALGSVRLVTGNDGEVLARHDYLPFGEEVPAGQFGRAPEAGYGGTDGVPQRFTGKERDTESDLDYFGARYYSGAQGRFTSVDPKLCGVPFPAHLAQPQAWNRYTYALNNPLAYVDPTGEDAEFVATFIGDFTDKEKKKILGAVKAYLVKLDIGTVVVREATDRDTRTVGQKLSDGLPFGTPSLFPIKVDANRTGTSRNAYSVYLGDLAQVQKDDPAAFVERAADGILHETLAHQLGAGNDSDNFAQAIANAGNGQTREAARRNWTLFDTLQARGGREPRSIRPLLPEDQAKVRERLKPIDRKYKD